MMLSQVAPSFAKLRLAWIFIVFQIVNCIGMSLENDVVCDIKWTGGGVLEEMAEWEEHNKKCYETNMFDDRAIAEKIAKNITLEEFAKVDDNCFVQCTYKADKILTDEGFINKNETQRIFKGNLTEAILTKAVSIWDGCITDSEKIAKEKGQNNCKMLALHDFCFSTKSLEAEIFKIECLQKPSTSTPSY